MLRSLTRGVPLILVLLWGSLLPQPSSAQTWVSTATQGLGNLLANATPAGPLPDSAGLRIAVALRLNNRDSLVQYVKAINDPTSIPYSGSLTVSQFEAAYGPTTAPVQSVTR